jgi:peptidoglycan-N-acetylglucosamine deacetylase
MHRCPQASGASAPVPCALPVRPLFLLLVLLALCAGPRTCCAQQVAITFDDLPAHSALPPGTTRLEIAQRILAALKAAGVPPTFGFVNGKLFDQTPEAGPVLDAWRAGGNPLGSHTWSHMDLGKNPLAAWEDDVKKNEPVLARFSRPGDHWHWLRFPFLAEGDTPEKRAAARAFLRERGYRIAAVTMSFGDYAWNEPYARCAAKGDTAAIASLENSYLEAAQDDIAFRRTLAKATFGHDIPYVLLMHLGALDAQLLPRLLALYREAGFRFVSLQEAEKDPFYANDLDLQLPSEPDTLEAAARRKGVSPWPRHTALPAALNTLCR